VRKRAHAGITGGHHGRPTRAEEIETGLRCECGVMVDVHPPLAKPLPWAHGRPCDRPATLRPSIWTLSR